MITLKWTDLISSAGVPICFNRPALLDVIFPWIPDTIRSNRSFRTRTRSRNETISFHSVQVYLINQNQILLAFRLISCESKYDDEVFHSGNNDKERDERHREKFNNELNHPLMSLASRKITEITSLSPTDSGISSQSSTPGLYQKYNQPCRNSYRYLVRCYSIFLFWSDHP